VCEIGAGACTEWLSSALDLAGLEPLSASKTSVPVRHLRRLAKRSLIGLRTERAVAN
jgi:hypothetical protein